VAHCLWEADGDADGIPDRRTPRGDTRDRPLDIELLVFGKEFWAQKRVTRGIYGYIKHPMYKGIMLAFLGLSFASRSLSGAWYSILVLCPLLFIRAQLEERKLE
jgi:hypothetical protein